MAMKKIFISYRRGDSRHIAGRIADQLAQVLPRHHVFLDVSTIQAGEDFEEKITRSIERADVFLCLIGPNWLGNGAAQGARIASPDDYVHREVRTALEKGKRVLPVLIDDTRMPAPEMLPEAIRPLCKRNALLLRHEAFERDLDGIATAALGLPLSEIRARRKRRAWLLLAKTVAGVLAGLLFAVILALAHYAILDRPLSLTIGSPGTTLLIVMSAVCGGLLTWLSVRGRPD